MTRALKAATLESGVLDGFNSVQRRMILAALAVGVRAAEADPDEAVSLVFAKPGQLKGTQKVKINLSDLEGTLEVTR